LDHLKGFLIFSNEILIPGKNKFKSFKSYFKKKNDLSDYSRYAYGKDLCQKSTIKIVVE